MSADNVLGWAIVLKISHLPSKLRFSAKCSFFGQSLSRGHYQPTNQPPEGVYLLNAKVWYPHMWRYWRFHWYQVVSLKLYLNSLVYHRNIFGSSSKVFGNLQTSLKIFGNSRKYVREHSSGLRNRIGKSSESGRKSSENHQKRRV